MNDPGPVITDSERYEAAITAIIEAYKNVIMCNQPEAAKLGQKLFSTYAFALREKRRLEKHSPKVLTEKGAK